MSNLPLSFFFSSFSSSEAEEDVASDALECRLCLLLSLFDSCSSLDFRLSVLANLFLVLKFNLSEHSGHNLTLTSSFFFSPSSMYPKLTSQLCNFLVSSQRVDAQMNWPLPTTTSFSVLHLKAILPSL